MKAFEVSLNLFYYYLIVLRTNVRRFVDGIGLTVQVDVQGRSGLLETLKKVLSILAQKKYLVINSFNCGEN